MKLRDKILLIVIIILVVLISLTIVGGLYLNKDTNIYYDCSKEISDEEDILITLNNKLEAKEDGTVLKVTSEYIYKYNDIEAYNAAKIYYESLEDELELNENKLEIKVISNTNDYVTLNEKDEVIDTWYKSYLNNMKELEYTCIRK